VVSLSEYNCAAKTFEAPAQFFDSSYCRREVNIEQCALSPVGLFEKSALIFQIEHKVVFLGRLLYG